MKNEGIEKQKEAHLDGVGRRLHQKCAYGTPVHGPWELIQGTTFMKDQLAILNHTGGTLRPARSCASFFND